MELMKINKSDPIKRMVCYCPKTPRGSIFIFGKIRAGKSLCMLSIAQKFHDYRGLKIFDIWGGERNQGENLYWAILSPYEEYWTYWKRNLRLDKEGPKQYKVNFLYPMMRNMPKELPHLKDFVNSFVFRIPFKQITSKNLSCIIGSLSSTDETLWDEILYEMKDSDGCAELIKKFQKKNATRTSLYKNCIRPLIDHGLLCSMKDENILDIRREMKNKEIVSVLVHHYIPERYSVFVLDWMMQRIYDLSGTRSIPKDIIILMREASKFFRAKDKSVIADRYKVFKSNLQDFMRYARGKMHLILDSQSPDETKGFLDGNQDLSVLGLLPGADDRKQATEMFEKDGYMTKKQVGELGELDSGEYFFIEPGTGKLAEKRYLLLPRTRYYQENDGSFYKIWENKNGSQAFINVENVREDKIKIWKEKLKEINQKEKEEKEERQREAEKREKEREKQEEIKKLEKYKREKIEKQRIRDELNQSNPKPKENNSKGETKKDKKEKENINNQKNIININKSIDDDDLQYKEEDDDLDDEDLLNDIGEFDSSDLEL